MREIGVKECKVLKDNTWMKIKQKACIHKVIFGIWMLFLIYLLISVRSGIIQSVNERGSYVRLTEWCVFAGIYLEYKIFRMFSGRLSENGKRILIFSLAFGIRILSLALSRYTPTNDFANYFDGSCIFAQNGITGGFMDPLDGYGIPSFAGLAIINGFLLRILSPTLFGMQVLNGMYTAGICVLIYEMGRKMEEPEAAVLGAAVYTFYPAGIITVHITSNVHGAAFFMLLGIYFYYEIKRNAGVRKRLILAATSAACLTVSNYYHPSAGIVLCAFIVYAVGCEVPAIIHLKGLSLKNYLDIRRMKGHMIVTIAVLIFYFLIFSGSLALIKNSGLISTPENSIFIKFALGFNYETTGEWNEKDVTEVFSYPPEEQSAVCVRMIKERSKDLGKVLDLMIEKTKKAWFGEDNYYYFYMDGVHAYYNESLEEGLSNSWIGKQKEKTADVLYSVCRANNLFVYVVWFFAVIGIMGVLLKKREVNIIYLLMYVPFGWMAFIMISEQQSRYRYQGFIMLVLLAAYGGIIIKRKLGDLGNRFLPACRKA